MLEGVLIRGGKFSLLLDDDPMAKLTLEPKTLILNEGEEEGELMGVILKVVLAPPCADALLV